MPVYKTGQGIEGFRQDMQMKIKYPEKAAEKGITGTVYLKFIVNKKGEAVKPEMLRETHPLLKEAAIKAFEKMPDWKKAGEQRGQKVNVLFNIPVVFKLDEENSNS
jgi:TonB family protein